MEAVLLTIALLYIVWSTAILMFDADIWLKNKLKAEKPKDEAKESPPPHADDFIVKHTYTVTPKTEAKEQEQVTPKENGEATVCPTFKLDGGFVGFLAPAGEVHYEMKYQITINVVSMFCIILILRLL